MDNCCNLLFMKDLIKFRSKKLKFKAFSLAEIMITVMILGVIAALTVPSTMDAIKYREHLAAYKVAFEKVASVYATAPTDDGEPTSTYRYAQNFWNAFYSSQPSLGFISPSTNIVNDSSVKMSSHNIRKNARWGESLIGIQDWVALGEADTFSPWVVLENHMAFTFRTRNNVACETSNQLLHHGVGATVEEFACLMVVVDVNGLEEGPNTLAAVTKDNNGDVLNSVQVSDDQMYNLVKDNDRFRIYITKTGVSAGADETLEYLMMHTK